MDAIPKPQAKIGADAADEKRLIAGLRNGDPGSYEYLVATYGGRLLSVARRVVKNEEDARDCVQEAFLQAFRGIGKFEERSSLGSWLHRIVLNAALMKIRARNRRPEETLDELMPQFDEDGYRVEPEVAWSVSVETLIQSKQVSEFVRRSIDQLPDHYRNVLIIRDIEGYNTDEAAELLGLPPGTVKVRLHRARSALKTLLTPVMRRAKV